MVLDKESQRGPEKTYRFDVDLDEGEYDYTRFELPGDLSIRLVLRSYENEALGMLVRSQEFDEHYPGGDDISGYFVSARGADDSETERGSSGGSSEWYLIADNTDYSIHDPDGTFSGRLSLVTW